MIMEGINEKMMAEHEDYIRLKERVDVAVGLMKNDDFLNRERLLTILGTEEAIQLLSEIRKKSRSREKRI